jgi:hypothetical protein
LQAEVAYARYEGGGSRNQPFHPAMMPAHVAVERALSKD